MSLLVQKFGGTSVGSPERIRAVADRIAATRAEGHDLVVVVSAMGQTTDELVTLAHAVSKEPSHREMDMLLTAGERISMALLSMALGDRGIPAVSFTGSQTGIITDGSHRRARIVRIIGSRVKDALREGRVAIVAGFQGMSEAREITTLGRGGSDTTAVALAAALKAEACEIYTDVDGVCSADPRVVPDARRWRRIPHDLMTEMAVRGAGVLHPRSVQLAKQHGVRLRVLNSLRESEGTEVVSAAEVKGMEEFDVTGVSADADRELLTVELMRASVMGALWDVAAQGHLSLLAPVFHGTHVQLFVEREAEADWNAKLQRLATDGFVREYRFDAGQVPISIVGNRFSQDGAAIGAVMETLAEQGIPVTMGSVSALGATVSVPATHTDDAVRALYGRFLAMKGGQG
jgi:aspartate kinase